MKLTDEPDECFESETGAPTLTVIVSERQHMIAYSGFRDALMESGRITMRFRDWQVVVTGESLEILWRQFQMQDVRLIRLSNAGTAYGSKITGIDLQALEEQ
jgi:hypothetical protein